MLIYYVYRPKKNASRTDITDDDQKAYVFASTNEDMFTDFQCHMISVVVFSSLKKLQSMLVDCAVTDMGWFDCYLDDAPHAKKMRGNGITLFLLHVDQYIIVSQMKLVTATLIAKDRLKSLNSRSVFKVIKDFANLLISKRLARSLIMSQGGKEKQKLA